MFSCEEERKSKQDCTLHPLLKTISVGKGERYEVLGSGPHASGECRFSEGSWGLLLAANAMTEVPFHFCSRLLERRYLPVFFHGLLSEGLQTDLSERWWIRVVFHTLRY